MMKITVFTATYNRADLLEKAWRSIVRQGFDDVEWVVVDDGSTDDTKEIIDDLKDKSSFEIRYKWKGNGGKHTAINEGVEMSRGELFVILDSDDELEDCALRDIWNVWSEIEDKSEIGGVCGLMRHSNGERIGAGFPCQKLLSDSIAIRSKYGVEGDLMEVFRTDVLREFPFPEIDGERFCPEQLVWFRIARKYRLLFVNHIWCVRDYQKNGLTDKIIRIRRESPIASMMTYSEATRYDIGLAGKVRAAVNYWRFWQSKKGVGIEKKWWWCFPVGMMMRCFDIIRN